MVKMVNTLASSTSAVRLFGSNPKFGTSSYGFHLLLNDWQHEDAREKHKAKVIKQTAVIDAWWHTNWQIEIATYIKLHDLSAWLKARGNL